MKRSGEVALRSRQRVARMRKTKIALKKLNISLNSKAVSCIGCIGCIGCLFEE